MKVLKKSGAVSQILQVFIADSSSTIGAGLTGLVFNSASLTAYYHRKGDTTATAISLVTMTVGTFTASGFKEIDAANMPGWYQLCPPDACFAAGDCAIHLKGATNMAPLPIEIQTVSFDPDDTVRLGLTAIPNVASGSAGALIVSGTGTAALSVASGLVTVAAAGLDAPLDSANGVETGISLRQALRIFGAALAGKVSGANTNAPTFKNMGGTTDRIAATTDSAGNRTAVTLTP